MFHNEAKLNAIGKAFGTPLKLGLSKEKSDSMILAEVGSGCPHTQTGTDVLVTWLCLGSQGFPAVLWTWLNANSAAHHSSNEWDSITFSLQNPPAIAWFLVQLWLSL